MLDINKVIVSNSMANTRNPLAVATEQCRCLPLLLKQLVQSGTPQELRHNVLCFISSPSFACSSCQDGNAKFEGFPSKMSSMGGNCGNSVELNSFAVKFKCFYCLGRWW